MIQINRLGRIDWILFQVPSFPKKPGNSIDHPDLTENWEHGMISL